MGMAKKALCIGINDYPGTGMDLRGCVNDANDWAAKLTDEKFEVARLLDGDAKKAAMVSGIRALVTGASSGDSLVITFSGHGTYAPDADGEEPDGLDEALCPHDITQGEVLIDDEIHQLFKERAAGVKILLISDSCHSGTVTRSAPAERDATTRARFLPMGNWLKDGQVPRGANNRPLVRFNPTTTLSPWAGALALGAGSDLLLAGCAEGPNNFSYDATINNRANGAFTYYALKALKSLDVGATYAHWHKKILESLPSASYPQTPQIFGSKASRRRKIFT
jgi:metacaspase-1